MLVAHQAYIYHPFRNHLDISFHHSITMPSLFRTSSPSVHYPAILKLFHKKNGYNDTICDAATYMCNKLSMIDISKLSNAEAAVITDLKAAVHFITNPEENKQEENKQKRRRMYASSRADLYDLTLRVSQIIKVASGLPVSVLIFLLMIIIFFNSLLNSLLLNLRVFPFTHTDAERGDGAQAHAGNGKLGRLSRTAQVTFGFVSSFFKTTHFSPSVGRGHGGAANIANAAVTIWLAQVHLALCAPGQACLQYRCGRGRGLSKVQPGDGVQAHDGADGHGHLVIP